MRPRAAAAPRRVALRSCLRGFISWLIRRAAREPCLYALHFICLNNDRNVSLLSATGAWGIVGAFIEAALDGDAACAALVPHASVLLCELAGREDATGATQCACHRSSQRTGFARMLC